jgi:hypothetical protein
MEYIYYITVHSGNIGDAKLVAEGTPTGRLLLALQEVFGGDAAVP